MNSQYQLAQLNIAHLVAPVDAPELVDFVANLDRINALAEAAPGFVWRLQTPAGDATALRPFGDDYIVNLSVWDSMERLHDYVYRTDHTKIMRRKKEWFQRMDEAHMVLWWVAQGHHPDETEAKDRLQELRANGPSQLAFTFKHSFSAPQ